MRRSNYGGSWFLLGFCTMLLFMGTTANAQTNFNGTNPASGTPPTFVGNSVNAVIVQAQTAQNAAMCDVNSWAGNGSSHISAGPVYAGIFSNEHKWTYSISCTHNSTGTDTLTTGGTVWADVNSCDDGSDPLSDGTCADPAPECPFSTGEQFIKSGNGTAPAGFCDQGCSFSPSAGGANISMDGGWMGMYEVGGSCSPDDGSPPDTDLNCLVTSSGTQYCADTTSPQNCGTVNGEYTCLEAVPPGNCIFTAGGQAVCDGGSQTDVPDDTITDGDGNEYDVYADGNTGGTDGGTGTSSGTDDANGDGISDTDGTGDTQPGDCDGTNCAGTVPGANEAVDGFAGQFATFYGRVESSPLIGSFSGLAGSLPTGSCTGVDSDPLTFLGGAVLTMDIHCTMWPDIAPILSGIMMAVWVLIGGIIILRA